MDLIPVKLRKSILDGLQTCPHRIKTVLADTQQKGKYNMVILSYRTKQSAPDDKCKTQTFVIDDMEVLEIFLHLVICLLPQKRGGSSICLCRKGVRALRSLVWIYYPLDEEWCNIFVW